ncbi:MAG: hypothetical protein JXJ20_00300 [Anaerolineae bacterium]|nr:hypothetical protein [Anaerolineae bacterium]
MADRSFVRGVFLLFVCLYALSLGRGFYSSDGEVMFKTTAALVERSTLALDFDPGLPQIVAGQGGRSFSKYDPGLPLVGVPFYVTGDWIGRVNNAHRYRLAVTCYLLVPVLAAAGSLAALAALARALFGVRRAAGVVLEAGLATLLWPYARVLYAETLLACALTGAVVLIMQGWPLAAGVVFGIGVLTRAALAIYALPLALLIAWTTPGRDWRAVLPRLFWFAVGMMPFGAALLAHNVYRFGDPLQTGYAGEGFTTPVWEGVIGLLVSPGKSVFLYAPPLALSAALWPRFRRAYPALGGFLTAAWGVALVFLGAWWAWHGGWCWGPRLLVPLIPLSCLPLGVLPDRCAWRRAAVGVIALGIGVQLLGVLTDVIPHYADVVGAGTSGYKLVHYAPRHTPLAGAIRRLLDGQTEPLALFRLADTGLPPTWAVGVPLLLALGLVVGAWWVWCATTRSGSAAY